MQDIDLMEILKEVLPVKFVLYVISLAAISFVLRL